MFAGFGRARQASCVTFVSAAALADGVGQKLDLKRELIAVKGTRAVMKRDMKLNDATPKLEVDPETYEVRADGELLVCEPATVLPMAQRYFLF
jgi:urease subunit alpha